MPPESVIVELPTRLGPLTGEPKPGPQRTLRLRSTSAQAIRSNPLGGSPPAGHEGEMPPMKHAASPDNGLRSLWLAIALLGGVIAAIIGGAVYRLAGGTPTEALTAGAAVFAGAMTLWFAMSRYIGR